MLKFNINFNNKKPLSFQKGIFKKGMRANEEVIVPARRVMFIETRVQTTAKVLATIPFNFDRSLIVADSVAEVVKYKTHCEFRYL